MNIVALLVETLELVAAFRIEEVLRVLQKPGVSSHCVFGEDLCSRNISSDRGWLRYKKKFLVQSVMNMSTKHSCSEDNRIVVIRTTTP